MLYLIVKHLHISFAILSILFFCVRFSWSLMQHSILTEKWVKVTPHIIDTLLLSFAIYLIWSAKIWPSDHPWLMAKLIALVVYIALGSIAIKRGKSQRIRLLTGLAAISTFIYMINVAISKQILIVL